MAEKNQNGTYLSTIKARKFHSEIHRENKEAVKVTYIKRECLKCERMFSSASPFNRVCSTCKKGFEFDENAIL